MRKHLFAAVAALALTSPAIARDGSGYVGIEGGALFPRDIDARLTAPGYDERFFVDQKTGLDLDIIGGYDFGAFRAEAELGWKRTKHDAYGFSDDEFDDEDSFSNADGNTRVISLMANALLDAGDPDGLSFYGGGGAGWAWTKFKIRGEDEPEENTASFNDDGFAWQLIAGVRYALTPQTDIGLKYRYFQTKFNRDDLFDDEDDIFDARGKFKSHSLLLSLVYNFAPPAVAPVEAAPYTPPPAPAPATQTCADGTVISATDACPPPPAPPAVRAGERG